jgi:hypothetical protein
MGHPSLKSGNFKRTSPSDRLFAVRLLISGNFRHKGR